MDEADSYNNKKRLIWFLTRFLYNLTTFLNLFTREKLKKKWIV